MTWALLTANAKYSKTPQTCVICTTTLTNPCTSHRFYRAMRMHSADCRGKMFVSVCPSVCPSHAGILSKRLHISSKFFHRRVTPPF